MVPNDRRYASSHEWIKLDGDVATIGITDHAQEALGDITYVELPAAGDAVEAEREFGVIESVKAASDLYAPVAGNVVEVNQALNTTPELINQDPYGKGWMMTLEGVSAADMEGLLDAARYEALIQAES